MDEAELLKRLKRSGREKPMTMLEKLTEYYNNCENSPGGNGYVWETTIGFYRDVNETVNGTYEFPQGNFTIRSFHEDGFYLWHFDRHDKS